MSEVQETIFFFLSFGIQVREKYNIWTKYNAMTNSSSTTDSGIEAAGNQEDVHKGSALKATESMLYFTKIQRTEIRLQ